MTDEERLAQIRTCVKSGAKFPDGWFENARFLLDVITKHDAEIERLREDIAAHQEIIVSMCTYASDDTQAVKDFVRYKDVEPLFKHFNRLIEFRAMARTVGIREGRRQMREEAVQCALAYRGKIDAEIPGAADNQEHLLGRGYAANLLAKRICALPDDPPTQEPSQ